LDKFEEDSKSGSDLFEKFEKKPQKTLTFITVFVLGIILFWSVGLGYIRRSSENGQKRINMTRDLISQKLNQAEQVSFLNMSSALSLISDSKEEVKKLSDIRKRFEKQIVGLEKMVFDTENKILKKEEKNYTEFFDLMVDDKNAKGNKLYLNDDNILISDKDRGVLYELSIDKKSLDKVQSGEVKKSSLIALFDEKKYFYVPSKGIYQIINNQPSFAKASAGEAKKVIEFDKDWGNIIDLAVFNGNIYLLDQEKNQIYKYMTAEVGFGGKSSYFQPGQSINLTSVNSLAIDGSIYLAGDSVMFKYTSGLQDGFKTNLPDDNINVTKIFTSKDLEKVYAWDKKKGTVYVTGKNGDYQEQINSKILSTGTDLVIYNDAIYLLQGSKIYKI
jgi:hypothetical protein